MGESRENYRCCSRGNELRAICLDFGEVAVGATAVKAVKIRNDNCMELSYEVHRDPITNPLDIVFHFDKYSWCLDANTSTICQIQYRPFLPWQKSIDYFTIASYGRPVLNVVVKGLSIGPKAIASADSLVMICAPGESVKKRIKISNDSDASANFAFDVDEKQNAFKPEPIDGSIGPRSHIYITITFRPTFEGPHAFYLACLVQHQAPIIILLNGYCGKNYSRDNISTVVYPSENDSFRTYMIDSPFRTIRSRGTNPCDQDQISLSNNYLDFGQTVPGSRNSMSRSPLTTCFTNHTEMDMLVKWHDDIDGIFSLKPNEARVREGETCLIEVRFDPDEQNEFYSREITAIAFWIKRDDSVPIYSYSMITSIRLMGHTFPAGSSSWIPQYEVPKTLIMPPCLPSSSVCTTFSIRRFGHMPLMFRFVPPKDTRFSVKPMMGIIHNNHRVIVVEMFPKLHGELLYERWSIIFNGNPDYEVFLDFRGYAEYPRLSMSREIVTFPSTHPGCEQIEQVAVRNPTRHRITYWFDDDSSPTLSVDRVRGEISSNEIIIHNWRFCPPEEGDYDFNVTYYSNATNFRERCKIIESQLHVVGKSESGYVLATPNEVNFGEQACGEERKLSFQLINPGPVEIPFILSLKCPGWPYEEKCNEEVTINPLLGNLCPGEKQNIEVSLIPIKAGLHELSIQYCIRRNSQTDELLSANENKPLEICRIKYFCVLPVIKVEDLLPHRMGPNISKNVLWRLLNINKLNKILNDLQPGKTENLEMSLPPMILQDEKSTIQLLISNPTSFVATWSFKQIKLCNCSKTSEKRGLSIHYRKYNCSHKRLCTIYPKSGSLEARDKTTITMELCFATLGETRLKWNLDLGHDRRLSLSLNSVCLSGLEKSAFLLYGPKVDLEAIYIGDRNPINQICWIYNPTKNDIAYSLDEKAFDKVNEDHNCEIFSCSNPSGTVKACSYEPILINFRPRRWGTVEVKVQLSIGTEKTAITIKGEATNDPLIKMHQKMSQCRDILCLPEVPVHFNTDDFTLAATPTHSRVTRLFTVHNRSENDVIAYEWKRNELPGIIEVNVEPKTGRIQPGTLQTHRLIVLTRGKPCKIDADVTCEFINQSEKQAYEKSVLMHNILAEEMKHHFTITEKGTTVPKPKNTAVKEPQPFYKILTVRCHIYSPLDEESKTRRKERLKNTPPLEISMENTSAKLSGTEQTIALSKFIIEGMIWKILQSTNLNPLPNSDIKYSQIATNSLNRKRIKERNNVKPSDRMMERIFENMIFTIIHKEFALDVIHLTQTRDARQVAYHKMWQQVPHQKGLEWSPDF